MATVISTVNMKGGDVNAVNHKNYTAIRTTFEVYQKYDASLLPWNTIPNLGKQLI